MEVLHQCSSYLARYNRVSSADVAVIVFEPLSEQPSLDGDFFGEVFFQHRGINAIGVKPARNDWYQDAAMEHVINAIRYATHGMRLVGYGGSMGAYAVINFAEELCLQSLLAIGPQFSIDPAKVPFETRWSKEAQEIEFYKDNIGRSARNSNGWILYDPLTKDAQHVELILAHHDFVPVQVYFADHHPLAVLQETGLTEQLLLDLVRDQLDRQRFVRLLRQRRRSSQWVWLHLSKALQGRGNIDAALRAVEIGKTLRSYDPFPLDVQHACVLIQAGSPEAAIKIIASYAHTPEHSAEALCLIGEWRTKYEGLSSRN